jgi:hypothetical protein
MPSRPGPEAVAVFVDRLRDLAGSPAPPRWPASRARRASTEPVSARSSASASTAVSTRPNVVACGVGPHTVTAWSAWAAQSAIAARSGRRPAPRPKPAAGLIAGCDGVPGAGADGALLAAPAAGGSSRPPPAGRRAGRRRRGPAEPTVGKMNKRARAFSLVVEDVRPPQTTTRPLSVQNPSSGRYPPTLQSPLLATRRSSEGHSHRLTREDQQASEPFNTLPRPWLPRRAR